MTDPATARPAASLILWQPGATGPEILMGLRGAGHRFMPNRLVFPGGAVDPGDDTAPAATEPRPDTMRFLRRHAPAPFARAIPYAAARELEEETALSLGTPPGLAILDYLCRAVTPPNQPIRFDARFFVAGSHCASGTLGGSGELEGLRYYAVAEVLELDLALVTREVLGQFRVWLDLSPGQRSQRTTTPVFSEKRWSAE